MTAALPIRQVEKPWGKGCCRRRSRRPRGADRRDLVRAPAGLPDLLVKYIFTSEKLSVQVHPTDAQTEAKGLGRQGKEECWLIVDAEAGATLGIGFDAPIGADKLREASRRLDRGTHDLARSGAGRLLLHPGQYRSCHRRGRQPDRSAAEQRHYVPAL